MALFHDWLVSTMNEQAPEPSLPPGISDFLDLFSPEIICLCIGASKTFIPPHKAYKRPERYARHPSAMTLAEVADAGLGDIDLGVLKNTLLRHTRHQEAYCLRVPRGTNGKPRGKSCPKECRFEFPKDLQAETVVTVEPASDEPCSAGITVLRQQLSFLNMGKCVPTASMRIRFALGSCSASLATSLSPAPSCQECDDSLNEVMLVWSEGLSLTSVFLRFLQE